MAKPNISPLTWRPSEQSLAFIDGLKAKGLTTTQIIEAGLSVLDGEISICRHLNASFDEVPYIKKLATNAKEGRKYPRDARGG